VRCLVLLFRYEYSMTRPSARVSRICTGMPVRIDAVLWEWVSRISQCRTNCNLLCPTGIPISLVHFYSGKLNVYMFMPVVSILGEAKCAVVWLLVVWVYVQWFVGLLRKNEFWEGVNLTVIAKSNRVEYVDSINY